MKLAITGATGFIGSRLLERMVHQDLRVSALTRRGMRPRRNVTWVQGALDDSASLAELVGGADAVIHIAGLLTSRKAADFEAVNVAGTAAVVDTAKAAGVQRFVHVSTLAARHPEISLYGASKARGEDAVSGSGLAHAIVRPPAVYGPGDKETLDLFRMAKYGLVLLPSSGRLSLIHADDLADLLLTLAQPRLPSPLLLEPDEGRPDGLSQREFAALLGTAVGHRNLALKVPNVALRIGAIVDGVLRGGKAKLTPDRAAYFAHEDWVADPARAVPGNIWRPRIKAEQGLAETAAWYRDNGWL
jgi:nucleoside-diphosphate-sugar epimerase